jgi:hypothetical protein
MNRQESGGCQIAISSGCSVKELGSDQTIAIPKGTVSPKTAWCLNLVNA